MGHLSGSSQKTRGEMRAMDVVRFSFPVPHDEGGSEARRVLLTHASSPVGEEWGVREWGVTE
jgi:hypothetical protein